MDTIETYKSIIKQIEDLVIELDKQYPHSTDTRLNRVMFHVVSDLCMIIRKIELEAKDEP